MKFALGLLAMVVVLGATGWWFGQPSHPAPWTEPEIKVLRSLWLGSLPPLPPDPTNSVADDPLAATLGHRLFFDVRLSANQQVACSTCHQPARRFTDGLSRGRGLAEVDFNSMSLVGAAYSPWYFWNGRKDSLWSQALAPLENLDEHGSTRTHIARLMTEDAEYRELYTSLFGTLPNLSDHSRFPDNAGPQGDEAMRAAWQAMTVADQTDVTRVFVNAGKALAAYQRLLLPGPSQFDAYVSAGLKDDSLDQHQGFGADEIAGLRLFIGKAQCTNCHNGPLLTNFEFHNTGVLPAPGLLPDKGRIIGVDLARADPFNCLRVRGVTAAEDCAELRFARTGVELIGAQKAPSLRNLGHTAPFMHAGQISTLAQVLVHYNAASAAVIGHNEAKPLNLRPYERRRLEAFLKALDAPIAAAPVWLAAPAQLH